MSRSNFFDRRKIGSKQLSMAGERILANRQHVEFWKRRHSHQSIALLSKFVSNEIYCLHFHFFRESIAFFHKKDSNRHFFFVVFRAVWKMGWEIIMDGGKFSFDSCAWRMSIFFHSFQFNANLPWHTMDVWICFSGLAGLQFSCSVHTRAPPPIHV